MRRQVTTAAGGLPVLLFLLGAVGMIWADVSWHARLGGLDGFVRLLVIPLLMAQFRRSDGGQRVLVGFFVSCVVLLAASFVVKIWPNIHPRPEGNEGVPVKSYIVQSLEFAMCAAVLFDLTRVKASLRQWKSAAACGALALVFLADIFFVTTGRTALVIIPALIVVYGVWRAGWKGLLGASIAAAVIASIVWFASPYVRERVTAIYSETEIYEQKNEGTSSGVRIEFWKKSLRFIESAPLFGHGTGSITSSSSSAAAGQMGARANPFDQPPQSNLRGRHSARPDRHCGAVGDVDLPVVFFRGDGTAGVGRLGDRDVEHRRLAVQFIYFRFHRRLDLRLWRRRGGGHGAAVV